MTLLLYSTAFIFFAKPCTYGKDYSIGERRKPLKARFWRRLEWVKQWLGYPSHYLPVVATGLIPRIYRRAAFPHRATPKSLPRE